MSNSRELADRIERYARGLNARVERDYPGNTEAQHVAEVAALRTLVSIAIDELRALAVDDGAGEDRPEDPDTDRERAIADADGVL
ncbi:hypothetical protein ACWDNI_35705 [Nocardia niigatensis]